MPQTVDRIDFTRPEVDPAHWPKLSCSAASQLALEDGSLRLAMDRDILFQDNGQIRSFDDQHKLVFNRHNNLLELHELGAIRFLTGGPPPAEHMRIAADGRIGIGTDAPGARVHIAGDLRIDSTLSVTGAAHLAGSLRVEGAIDATDIRQNGTPLTASQWQDVTGGINFAGGNVGIGVVAPQARLHVAGGQGNIAATEGDLKIGDDTFRLKIGVATGGASAGDVRLRAQGGTNRLMLGGGPNDVLAVTAARVGIGTLTPQETLDVNGRIRVGAFTLGAWPPNGAYAFVGVNTMDQTQAGSYALLQETAGSSAGRTFLNSPIDIRVRINNADKMTIGNNGNVNIIAPSQLNFGEDTRQMINLWSTGYGIGVQSRTQYFRADAHFAWFRGGTHNDETFNPGGGTRLMALNEAGDLILSGRTNPSANPSGSLCRALVDFNQLLIINYGNDFNRGVHVASDFEITGVARKPGGGPWAVLSDERVKKHIQPLSGALDKLLRLRGVCFEWQTPVQQGHLTGPQMGMIAQEVEAVFPEWISTAPDGYKELTFRGFEALTVEALRELHAAIAALHSKHRELETREHTLEAHVLGQPCIDTQQSHGIV